MITTTGIAHVKRFMAEYEKVLASDIAFGIGEAAEQLSDTDLAFESGRSPIVLKSYDFVNDKIRYKAILPPEYEGSIYELGLYANVSPETGGESRMISTFDSATEDWFDPATELDVTYVTGIRLGQDGVQLDPGVSATEEAELANVQLDLSMFSAADVVLLNFDERTVNTDSVFIQFKTDDSNYYEHSFTAVGSVSYKSLSVAKGSFAVTGSPSWSDINEVRVGVVSGAGGGSDIVFDGLRINDSDSAVRSNILVARKVLAVPFVKTEGMTQEIEYNLDIGGL